VSKNLNRVDLIGRIANDIEIKYSASGTAVVNATIVTNYKYKDEESAEFHRCTFFSKLAEIVSQYCKKGDQVYASGRLQTRKWQDKEGNDRYSTEVICNEMILLQSKRGPNEQPRDYVEPDGNSKPQSDNNTAGGDSFFDSEIPFKSVDWRAS